MTNLAIYRVFPDAKGRLLLTFPWVEAGSQLKATLDRSCKWHLSIVKDSEEESRTNENGDNILTVKRHTKTSLCLNITKLTKEPGYYRIRANADRSKFIIYKEKDEDVVDRVKEAWSRETERVTSNGTVIIPTQKRRLLKKNCDYFKFTVDVSNGYTLKIEPLDPNKEDPSSVRTRMDYMREYGHDFLAKCGRIEYKLQARQSGNIKMPNYLVRLFGDLNDGISYTYGNNYKYLKISKKSFFCPSCGEEEMWDVSGKVALHVCPKCAKNLETVKRLVPAAYLWNKEKDKEAAEVCLEEMDKKLAAYRGLIDNIESTTAVAYQAINL